MSIHKDEIKKSTKNKWWVNLLLPFTVWGLISAMVYSVITDDTPNTDNTCIVPFVESFKTATLHLDAGEKVSGELKVLDESDNWLTDYDVEFILRLPDGTSRDDIDYSPEAQAWSVDYTALSEDKSTKVTDVVNFPFGVNWDECDQTVHIRRLSTQYDSQN
jgi:hypothetical protein